eukprot:SAG31_NODE_783_length_12123_cov_5.272130_1_plen_90_part_00
MTRLSLLLALLLGGAATTARASAANISNVLPRRDTSGAIMDMHDGNVHVGDDGTYYWYAAGYGVSPPASHLVTIIREFSRILAGAVAAA